MISLYRKLKAGKIFVRDDIRRSLRITQSGHSVEGAPTRANFHLEEAGGALRLYLPKDDAERDICFESDLPRTFCSFFGVKDPAAPGVIGGVFRKDKTTVIEKILENAGIVYVDCDLAALDEDVEALEDSERGDYTSRNMEAGTGGSDEDQVSDGESDGETLVEAAPSARLLSPAPYHPVIRTFLSSETGAERRRAGAREEGAGDRPTQDSSLQEWQEDSQETAYRQVLELVVDVAKHRILSSIFESTGVSNPGLLRHKTLPQGVIRNAFPDRSQGRDYQVGAAGELYMFEYLKGLNLPDFGLRNWTSEIRDRVHVHPKYFDIKKSSDRSAIADIEYLDVSSKLTQFLIQKGQLAQEVWEDERPFYHIEVKTTTSPNWQEPFYMSKAQERYVSTSIRGV